MFCFDLNSHSTIDLYMVTSTCVHVLCIVNCMVFFYSNLVFLLPLIILCNSSSVDVGSGVHRQSSSSEDNFIFVGTLTFLLAPFLIAEAKTSLLLRTMMHDVDTVDACAEIPFSPYLLAVCSRSPQVKVLP